MQGLIRQLNALNLKVRVEAARSLGRSGSRDAVKPLLNAQSSSNDELRQAASDSLLLLGAKFDIIPDVMARVALPNFYSRKAAIWVLGRLGDRRAFEIVCSALRDKEAMVRRAAAYALGRFANSEAIPVLSAVVNNDADESVKAAVVDSLHALGVVVRPLPSLAVISSNIDMRNALPSFLSTLKVNTPKSDPSQLEALAKFDSLGDKKRLLHPPKKDYGMLAR